MLERGSGSIVGHVRGPYGIPAWAFMARQKAHCLAGYSWALELAGTGGSDQRDLAIRQTNIASNSAPLYKGATAPAIRKRSPRPGPDPAARRPTPRSSNICCRTKQPGERTVCGSIAATCKSHTHPACCCPRHPGEMDRRRLSRGFRSELRDRLVPAASRGSNACQWTSRAGSGNGGNETPQAERTDDGGQRSHQHREIS